MRKEECYFLGKIIRKHGLKGNVVLKLDTDRLEFYQTLESIFVEISGLLVPFFVEKSIGSKNNSLILSFKNTTLAMIEESIGKEVFLPLSTLPKLEGKGFYYHEVIGFEIFDSDKKSCGKIAGINDLAPQPYFVLRKKEKEPIIPIVKEWIIRVEREKKYIEMNLPEGLMDLF